MNRRKPRRQSHHHWGHSKPVIAEPLEHRLLLASGPVAADTSPGTFYVTRLGSSGMGTLGQAILDANNHPGPDTINFNLSETSYTIYVQTPLPPVSDTTVIDGLSQPNRAMYGPVTLIGTHAPADADGLTLSGGTHSVVRGLVITGFRNGVVITGGEGHVIGDSTGFNYILRNRGNGISVLGGSGHSLSCNHNLYNQGLPIDLGGDGITPPDANDADAGPNDLANAPVIDEASNLNQSIKITGTLSTAPGVAHRIDLYTYVATDPRVDLPAMTYLTSINLAGGPESVVPFSYSFTDTVPFGKAPLGRQVVAVATDADGSTSEFSAPSTVALPKFYVLNEADSGPGSLRQAILDANATPGFNALTVQIPGAYAHTVNLSSPLPEVTDAISLDNLAISTLNSHAFDGLVLASDNSTITVTVHGFRTGIVVRGNNNQIGAPPGSPLHNVIAYDNSVDGIRIESGVGNQLTRMSVYGSGHMSINLGSDDATPNDPLDQDTGPNQLQNAPAITSAVHDYTGLLLGGRLDSTPDTIYRIEVYGSDSAAGDARVLLGQFNVTTDPSGTVQFQRTLTNYAAGRFVTATATDPAGNTSELSVATPIAYGSTVVTNTDARGPGSLYAAIVNSELNPAPDAISFNIPGTGVHRISLAAADVFPRWDTDQLTIDATTQPGYAGTPLVELVGPGGSAANGAGLSFVSGNAVVIRGLAIGGFNAGIDTGAAGRIEANYIGLAADGSPLPNLVGVIPHGDLTIGGTVAEARNVISANSTAGIHTNVGASNITVQGNYIGTNPAGDAAIPNGVGILFTGGNDVIGGTVAEARNVISGNGGVGIRLDVVSSSFRTVAQFLPTYIQGNYIGLAADGVTPLPNGGDGILADGPAAFIGGTLPGQANLIAYNGGNGVTVAVDPAQLGSGQKTSVRGNAIFANAKLAIDLANDGLTPNDPLDPDTGPNTLQNFPVLTAAAGDASSTLVSGSLNSLANTTFTLDFYADAPTANQARTYLGSATVTTDAAGNATFTASLPTPTPPGQVVTATATGPATAPATSEFSAPLWVSLPGDANRDRSVDFNDLVPLAQNYNSTGNKTWSQGDFTGDGLVDFNDLVKLAQNYNTTLPTPGDAIPTQILHIAAAPMPSLASVLTQLDTPPAPIKKCIPSASHATRRPSKPAPTARPNTRSPFSSAPISRPVPAPIASPHARKRSEILG
jgi:hypothetical protein